MTGTTAAGDGSNSQQWERWIILVSSALPALAAVVALAFTWIQTSQAWVSIDQARDELWVNEQAQISNRLDTAVGNLQSESPEVRLGAVYALQRVAEDSERDRPTVEAVLSSFFQAQFSSLFRDKKSAKKTNSGLTQVTLNTDTQAALGVLMGCGPESGEPAMVQTATPSSREMWLPATYFLCRGSRA